MQIGQFRGGSFKYLSYCKKPDYSVSLNIGGFKNLTLVAHLVNTKHSGPWLFPSLSRRSWGVASWPPRIILLHRWVLFSSVLRIRSDRLLLAWASQIGIYVIIFHGPGFESGSFFFLSNVLLLNLPILPSLMYAQFLPLFRRTFGWTRWRLIPVLGALQNCVC